MIDLFDIMHINNVYHGRKVFGQRKLIKQERGNNIVALNEIDFTLDIIFRKSNVFIFAADFFVYFFFGHFHLLLENHLANF